VYKRQVIYGMKGVGVDRVETASGKAVYG